MSISCLFGKGGEVDVNPWVVVIAVFLVFVVWCCFGNRVGKPSNELIEGSVAVVIQPMYPDNRACVDQSGKVEALIRRQLEEIYGVPCYFIEEPELRHVDTCGRYITEGDVMAVGVFGTCDDEDCLTVEVMGKMRGGDRPLFTEERRVTVSVPTSNHRSLIVLRDKVTPAIVEMAITTSRGMRLFRTRPFRRASTS